LKGCCISGNMMFLPGRDPNNAHGSLDDVSETGRMLAESGVLERGGSNQARLEHALRTGCLCVSCSVFTDLPLVAPCCASLICSACLQPHRYRCPICQVSYLFLFCFCFCSFSFFLLIKLGGRTFTS
jgi:hypothetical protein